MLLGKKHFRTGNNNYADISKYFGIKYNLMAYPQSLNYIKLLSLKKLPVFFFFFFKWLQSQFINNTTPYCLQEEPGSVAGGQYLWRTGFLLPRSPRP